MKRICFVLPMNTGGVRAKEKPIIRRLIMVDWKSKMSCQVGHLCSIIVSLLTRTGWASLDGVTGRLSFNRMDTKTAREIRLEIYRFLAQYLSPPRAFKSVRKLEKEAYKF